jgi:UDP:flavonoid glycosyltransferase YjiC (YdhE family)
MKIVLSTIGSLGDLHPKLALGLELKRRGHDVVINTLSGYKEKIADLGLGFASLRPEADENDRELIRNVMDPDRGPEFVIRDLVFGNIRDMYEDVLAAAQGADALVTGELIYVADSVCRKLGTKWISTSLAPISLFSSHDPNVYMQAPWMEMLRPLPAIFHDAMYGVMRAYTSSWREPMRALRRDLGLDDDHDPMLRDKFSPLLHLVMFSRALSAPQPDWPRSAVQTGACYFDESETAELDPQIAEFLAAGEPPVIFTLGSAASMDPGAFFHESVDAAKRLGRRALFLYGRDCEPPAGLTADMAAFEYAPYSLVFPQAACIVHQAGVGTTGQVLRAGVPAVIVPYSHDQPDNAARCRRAGAAEVIRRDAYNARIAAETIGAVLSNPSYRRAAEELKKIVDSEHGTRDACDAIERVLAKKL